MTGTAAPWRTLIVDDEPLAREGIRTRLESLGGFDIVAECGGGRAAVAAIQAQPLDVVFLDVQMPVVDGFGVIAKIGADRMPAIVFVTAYEHYAVRAFDARALDYVLKPIDDARFTRALDSVSRRLREAKDSRVARQLAGLLDDVATHPSGAPRGVPVAPDRLVVRDGDRVEMIPITEIDWISADGDYVRIHAGNRQLLLRSTMTGIEAALPAGHHVRIHRSTIVNVARIRTLRTLPNNEYAVVLKNGVTLRASRSYTPRLRAVLGL